jgi:GR25 family glycosyltransferase involved in LPS biosynthesis
MKAYVITLLGNSYSERVATRCIESAEGIRVSYWPAIDADSGEDAMKAIGAEWTWGKGGAGLKHHSYGGNDKARIACAMSHYYLWVTCYQSDKEIMILEHDAVFIRPFKPFEYKGICQINDPMEATPRGDWWSEQMVKRGAGVWPKTEVLGNGRPDGLAGNSAYVIKPSHAKMLIDLVKEHGLWPNDAIMCRQLIPDLEEHYPFITMVDAEMSTI